jgi:type IV secretory pathway VirB2 component (pilin)
MRILWTKAARFRRFIRQVIAAGTGLLLAAPVFAQGNSPWENAVNVLQQAFTSTIARGLSLVAIVVSGLTFAFGEGGSKRVLAGVLFGVGMAIAAVNFLSWLFP